MHEKDWIQKIGFISRNCISCQTEKLLENIKQGFVQNQDSPLEVRMIYMKSRKNKGEGVIEGESWIEMGKERKQTNSRWKNDLTYIWNSEENNKG